MKQINKYVLSTPAGLLYKIGGTPKIFLLEDMCNNHEQGAIMWKGN